jgi:endonuclease YncB( thermonuclease family)
MLPDNGDPMLRAALIALAILPWASSVEVPATIVSITDGDTLTVTLADRSEAKVRLLYIDTPESKANSHGEAMPEGRLASEFLDLQAKAGSAVTLWGPGAEIARDRYGRLLAVIITSRGDTLQQRIIAAGWSPLWEKYGRADPRWRDDLQAAEDAASAGKLGAWSTAPAYMRNKANETTAPKGADDPP